MEFGELNQKLRSSRFFFTKYATFICKYPLVRGYKAYYNIGSDMEPVRAGAVR